MEQEKIVKVSEIIRDVVSELKEVIVDRMKDNKEKMINDLRMESHNQISKIVSEEISGLKRKLDDYYRNVEIKHISDIEKLEDKWPDKDILDLSRNETKDITFENTVKEEKTSLCKDSKFDDTYGRLKNGESELSFKSSVSPSKLKNEQRKKSETLIKEYIFKNEDEPNLKDSTPSVTKNVFLPSFNNDTSSTLKLLKEKNNALISNQFKFKNLLVDTSTHTFSVASEEKKKSKLTGILYKNYGVNTSLAIFNQCLNEHFVAFSSPDYTVEVRNMRLDQQLASFKTAEPVDMIALHAYAKDNMPQFIVMTANTKLNLVSINKLSNFTDDRNLLLSFLNDSLKTYKTKGSTLDVVTHSFRTKSQLSAIELIGKENDDFFYLTGLLHSMKCHIYTKEHEVLHIFDYNNSFNYNQIPWWRKDGELFILLGTPDNLYRGQIINLTTGKKVEREVNIHYSVHNSVVSYESKVPHWYTIQQNNYVIKYNLDTGEEVKQISYNKESKFNLITAVGNCLAVADKNASIYIVAKKTLDKLDVLSKVTKSQLKLMKGGVTVDQENFLVISEAKGDEVVIKWNVLN